jgi:hypothetical protein
MERVVLDDPYSPRHHRRYSTPLRR